MSTKQKKTIQKGSFKRLLKLFFFKNKMLTALMLFSIIISAVATALGPQYLGYATDSIVQDMSNPVSSNIHWDRRRAHVCPFYRKSAAFRQENGAPVHSKGSFQRRERPPTRS